MITKATPLSMPLKTILFVGLLMFGYGLVSSFQDIPEGDKLPAELEEMESAMSYYKGMEMFDSAMIYGEEALKYCDANNLAAHKPTLYRQVYECLIYNETIAVPSKLERLENDYEKLGANKDYLAVYYDAKMFLYLELEEMDSMQSYYDLTVGVLEEQGNWYQYTELHVFLAQNRS